MRRLALVVTLFLVSGVTSARADDLSPRPHPMQLELGLWFGGFFADDEHEFYDPRETFQELSKTVLDFGARLGFYPLSFLGIEGEIGLAPGETKAGDSVNLLKMSGHAVLQIPARITPFILGGYTRFVSRSDELGDDEDNDYHAGAGLKIFLHPRLQLRLDGRAYMSNRRRDGNDDNGSTYHFAANAGLTWTLGGASDGPSDRDGDGVSDLDDACPDEAGDAPTGCPASRDTDGDGIDVPADKCPDQPETVNGHEDTDGCPDELPDTDNDGVTGAAEKCPTEPEDTDKFQDEDGCPDPDNDGDGVLDTADGCPEEAGSTENRGCPDKDRDGDGVVDRSDNCPDEAGTADNQGCKSKQLVVLTQTQLKILDKVYFKTGRAVIDKKSNKLLDQIAAVLNAHPEIVKIRIEGHTDDQGADDTNKALSQKRAEAVAVYLSRKGVGSDRLEPIGYGEERPIADNSSKDGRAENRRVEFNIVGDEAAAPAAPPLPTPTP